MPMRLMGHDWSRVCTVDVGNEIGFDGELGNGIGFDGELGHCITVYTCDN